MSDIFPIALFLCFILWALNKYFSFSWLHNLRNSPQTYHKKSTSRFGGIAIFLPLLIISLSSNSTEYQYLGLALLCSTPIFILGLIDDLNISIHPLMRIFLAVPSPVMYFFLLELRVESVSIPAIDYLLSNEVFGLMFLVFAIVGIVNAFNIIDGFNGLLLAFCIMLILSMFLVNGFRADLNWITYIVAIFFAILAVFLVNFPFGKIFLGDGGAYLLGALIPVGLIKLTFDNNFSPWYVLAMLIYPVTEVLFSIFRKVFIRKKSALEPDGLHFHMLIYKKVTKRIGFRRIRWRHFIVTASVLLLNFPFMLAANYFSNDTFILMLICLWFLITYSIIYFLMMPRYLFKKK
jgi:UDP-N-acetylmuramyl pentapeptide phosphotransferase/UDP-N-acetylglucosamine-1-phosphate transferase